MGGVILLTGATGFLGTQVARRLLERTDHDLVALVHAAGPGRRPAAGCCGPGGTGRSWPRRSVGEQPRWPVTVGAAGWRSWPATSGHPGSAWSRPPGTAWPAASPTSSTPPPTCA